MAKIYKITKEAIEFMDGTLLYTEHQQECCELVVADLRYLYDEAGVSNAEFDTTSLETLVEFVPDFGFRLIDVNGVGYSCPCYDFGADSGYYYSDNISLQLYKASGDAVEVDGHTIKAWDFRDDLSHGECENYHLVGRRALKQTEH